MDNIERFYTRNVFAFGLLAVIFCSASYAQRSRPRSKSRIVKPAVVKQSEPLPGYDFDIKVFADGNMQLQVNTGYETRGLSNTLLERALTEYVEMTSSTSKRTAAQPRISIRPEPGTDLSRVMEIARSARRSGAAQLQIVTPDNISLEIGPEPKDQGDFNVKPDPLFLLVAIHKDHGVTLNNESYGNSSDPSALQKMLISVFREREDNGVFRGNTNEIEKTVYLSADVPARFSDLIDVARSVRYAGARPIFLVIDDDPILKLNDRFDLIPVP